MRQLQNRKSLKLLMSKVFTLCAVLAFASAPEAPAFGQAQAQDHLQAQIEKREQAVAYQEDGTLSEQLKIPTYSWSPATGIPRGILVAIHGLAMHGHTFDGIGRTLAGQGYLVVATDLRGYGHYMGSDHKYCSGDDCKIKTDYERSYDDIVSLMRSLRERYPSLPVFAMGESLGGAVAIKLAALNPELVDGLVLSAPAVKRHSFIDPNMIADAGLVAVNPRAQLDLMPFVRRFASDDPRVVSELVADPMLRRHMSAYELWQVALAVRKTISYIPAIPSDTPVLVIQGSADRCIRPASVMALLSHLRSVDQTVKWFHERGHILLETEYVKPDTQEAVVGWVNSHVNCPLVQAKCNRTQEYVAQARAPQVVGVTADAKAFAPKVAAGTDIED